MAIIKCKMCGGDLNIVEGESVCECEYCGTRQTIPTADNEKKLTLFARANRLRLSSEFDKAFGIYESIVADFPEEAEAYWGLVLCKYGIEYVDDPATGKKIPTCHRSSFDSVMEDSDFEQACENADGTARRVYREEAKQIEEIRKGILEVSGKEEPYDIFICYKETDENGERTLDSVLAQDIYDALTDKGYRVFFSRITLEDKLGQEYEPYIFAALNSAKIMLAVGTDYEYYNAVWVKNEWSRYLKLMAKDKDKHLIPCYKNLDAYDMPKEFAKLQAQDLGKVGAIQDLLRGVEKLLGGSSVQEEKPEQTFIVKAEAPGVESLLKRADMFREDEERQSAIEYYDRVLDINPECAAAYLGKNLVEYACTSIYQAAEERKNDFFKSKNFKKVERFADNILKNKISEAREILSQKNMEYAEKARNKREQERKEREAHKIFLEQKRKKIEKVKSYISAGSDYTVGIKSDGTIIMSGQLKESWSNFSDWTDIVAISSGYNHSTGIRFDGTILAEGNNDYNQCYVSDWTDVIQISAGDNSTIGLCKDGSIIAIGKNSNGWSDVESWPEFISVTAGGQVTAALRKDGTVVAVGDNSVQKNVSQWTDIVAISAGADHIVGVRRNGSVIAEGKNSYGECDLTTWKDIIAISAGKNFTVGVCCDGSVVAAGKNNNRQCSVDCWRNIVSVSAGQFHTVGLRSDGTVVATGKNDCKECETKSWKLFGSLETVEQQQIMAHEQCLIKEARRKEEARLAEEQRREELRKLEEQRREAERKAEEQRQEEARKREEKRKLEEQRRSQGLCPYCGGTFKGLFKKVCTQCGKPKDY